MKERQIQGVFNDPYGEFHQMKEVKGPGED